MGFYLGKQERMFGLQVAPMHDVCALAPYVDPDLIRTVETSVKVELAGTHTRGMTVCDLRSVRPGAGSAVKGIAERNARRALRWNAEIIIMDEPTAALGVVQTRNVLDHIRRVR